MDELLTLPGVARKTGNVVLGCAFGIPSGVVVDTHVIRISNRLDLTKNQDPKKIEQDLMKIIPEDEMDSVFASNHLARTPRLCGAQSALRRMQPRARLLFQRQDGLSSGQSSLHGNR